jgi:PBP1b-binding outer membrane lipoprotein LpoB
MKHIVGIVVIGALALAGCGGSDEKVEIGVPAQSVATTSTTFKDSLVCIQDADSPCPSPSSATIPEDGAKDRAQVRAVQSELRNALTAEKTHYTDAQEYTADVATLSQILPSGSWDTPAPGP